MAEEKEHNEKRFHPLPWIVGIALLVGAAVLAGLYWDRTSRIEQVKFSDYKYVSLKQLQKKIEIPEGINPDSLNYKGVIRQIKEVPYVESVQLEIQFGGTLMIRVSEHQPIALLIDGSKSCLVDSNGVKLELKKNVPSVPLLYGFNVRPRSDTLTSTAFNHVSAFLQKLAKNPASNATVSAVTWSEENGIVALTNNGGVKLIFGKDYYKKRLRNWEAFYAQVVRYKGVNHFKSVNMSFEQQIVTHE